MASSKTIARPAQFDRSTQRKRSLFAKIHVAKKQLALNEDDYRQLLFDETGKASLTHCDEHDLERLVKRLQAIGFTPVAKNKPSGAQHPVARKARALWISLYHLNVVQNPSEAALEAFAKKQLGCEKLVWARQSHGYKLIEALKAMAKRAGWKQMDDRGQALDVRTLHYHLCEVILGKLKERDFAHTDWSLNGAALRLYGIELGAEGPVTPEQYQLLAKSLGDDLRGLGAAA